MVYYFIATKLRGANQAQTFEEIKAQVLSSGNGTGNQLICDIKNFKLGNLDTLMYVNQNLIKLESLIESSLKKIERQYLDITEKQKADFSIETSDGSVNIEQFVYSFKWDDNRFKRSVNLSEMSISLQQRVAFAESDLRTKTTQFTDTKNAANSIAQQEGNLYVKDLSEILRGQIVKPGDFIQTENLTTLIAIVSKTYIEEFLQRYENIHPNVLPGSAKKFDYEQKDLTLWRIVLLKRHYVKEQKEADDDESNRESEVSVKPKDQKNEKEEQNQEQKHQQEKKQNEEIKKKTPLEEFFIKARDLKVSFREFVYNPADYETKEKDRKELSQKVNHFQNILKRSCEISYGDLFSTYIHAKFLRFIVEIAMRFGADEKFCPCVIKPIDGKEKKIQQLLTKIFGDPSQLDMYGTQQELQDAEDFFPFVYVPINH